MIINEQTAGILLVLVFGAATDDAPLLIARHRESCAAPRTGTRRWRRCCAAPDRHHRSAATVADSS